MKRLKANPGRFTKARMKCAYAGSEIRIDERGEWLALRAAMRFTGRSKCYLQSQKEKCDLLGGRRLRTDYFKDGIGRETEFWFKSDLQDLKDALILASTVAHKPGYVSGCFVKATNWLE